LASDIRGETVTKAVENRELKRIFDPKRGEFTRDWRT
jgi:hypothetical protein